VSAERVEVLPAAQIRGREALELVEEVERLVTVGVVMPAPAPPPRR
jgi:hypothetical protein